MNSAAPLRRLWSAVAWLCLLLLWVGSGAAQAPGNGWSAGTTAAGMPDVLSFHDPVAIGVPKGIADRVKGETALFYFSPTCPHCQHAMPEINRLASSKELTFLGVSTGASSDEEMAEFKATYKPTFDIYIDEDRSFAFAFGARSTPSLYVVKPAPDPTPNADGSVPVLVVEAYAPWPRGLGAVLLARRHPDTPFASFRGYQGDATCAACHREEAKSWVLTQHAAAYRTLYTRDRATDDACVGCHVTGYGQPGGFENGDHSSPLADVTCEACHGPSGPHDGERTDARASCATCHDKKHSVAFTLEKGLPHIDHYAANTMSETAIQERLLALAKGEADRPMLAFPEGPTLGAASCAGCHKEIHRGWKTDPHGAAFTRLSDADRVKVECVRCHATPTASGPPPTEVSGYRTDEGVGCEACHGPGGAHVAAPSKDNILGLGESCPECVIENLCTSCHNPTWDPQWKLQDRLKSAAHKTR